MSQSQCSIFVDPFEEQSVLFLNPRTHRLPSDALKSKDLEATHKYMKSMALQSPDKHYEKTKSVIDGHSEFLKNKKTEASIKEKENPQHHRPGLVRKRAKFSMKPDTSLSNTVMEPTLELDQLQDPEEFFAAFEKFENTKKELKKQRGEDVNEVKTSTTVRKLRPEIPRKRKASYKHYEYSSQSQDDILQDNIQSPPQQESLSNLQSEKENAVGSITKTEKRVHSLFDELLASGINKLDANQAMSFLKDRINIKSVDITDLELPDFHELPTVDFISPVNDLLKHSKTLLPDTTTRVMPDVTKVKTPVTQKRLSGTPLGSPTPPRSPFLAISTFGKNMLKSLISNDPFSTHDVDSPQKTSSNIIGGESSHASKDNEVPLPEDKITETAIDDVDHDMEIRDADDNGTDVQRNKDINGNFEDMLQKEASVTEVDINVEGIIQEINFITNVQSLDIKQAEDVSEKEGGSSLPEVNAEVEVNADVADTSQPAETDPNSIEHLDTSGPTQNLDTLPEQQNDEDHHHHDHDPTPKTTEKRKKLIARKTNKKKSRQSLAVFKNKFDWVMAGAGSNYTTSGVRRSSRIKRRPLEYWNGERLLYARVHNSLPTVIGVKYISPGKSGFKVESFVSDKYKDLVELTALH
ncbi:hypothetical protein LXL04_032114 [Taraxacum kok-saghyz]